MALNEKLLSSMTIEERLCYILQHPADASHSGGSLRHDRSTYLTEALWEAFHVLPDGAGKRAISYLARNPRAEFYFTGGKDAVEPALREAMRILKAENGYEEGTRLYA